MLPILSMYFLTDRMGGYGPSLLVRGLGIVFVALGLPGDLLGPAQDTRPWVMMCVRVRVKLELRTTDRLLSLHQIHSIPYIQRYARRIQRADKVGEVWSVETLESSSPPFRCTRTYLGR